jgi:hypothetical protein
VVAGGWGKNTFRRHFFQRTSEINSLGLNQEFLSDKLTTNRLSYDMAKLNKYNFTVFANLYTDESAYRKFVIL